MRGVILTKSPAMKAGSEHLVQKDTTDLVENSCIPL